MVDFDDQALSFSKGASTTFRPEDLVGWTVRLPSNCARRWSALNGLAHGLVWAFPFVTGALLWQQANGATTGPAIVFAIGMILLLLLLLKGILSPRTWWFAYTEHELIAEHGVLFKARDHLAFDRVQYLERRTGPIMRSQGLASLVFDTAAGRAVLPAVEQADLETIETNVRAEMQRAAVI